MKWIIKYQTYNSYRFLFTLGGVCALIGVGFWPSFFSGQITFYPRQSHANVMFFATFWSFVSGFLMTSIPKMLNGAATYMFEVLIAAGMIALQVFFAMAQLFDYVILLFIFQIIFLLYFVLRRFIPNPIIPFSGFAFIPFALLQSLVVSIFILTGVFDSGRFLYLFCGEAFLLNLILGLGARLVPAISRLPRSRLPTESNPKESVLSMVLLATAFNSTYWIQVFLNETLGLSLRIAVIGFFLVKEFRFFVKPVRWSFSGVSLKTAVFFIFLGHVLRLPYFGNNLAGAHLTYIGGIAVVTLTVATRVMLSHGDQSLDYEVKSFRVGLISFSMLIAAVFRFFAHGEMMALFLNISAAFFLLAVLVWGHRFVQISFLKLKTDL